MSEHSNKTKKEEYIEILDHGYIVRKGSREVYCCVQSRRVGRCTRSECRRKHMRNRLHMRKIRSLRKKRREKKKEKKTKERSPEIEIISVQKPSHLLPQQRSAAPIPLNSPGTVVDLSIEGESASLPEPVSISAYPLTTPTEVEVPPGHNEPVAVTLDSSDASYMESGQPESGNDTVTVEADTGTIDVEKKILWYIKSAYHYRGVLSKEDVGDSPAVRLEPEPTNLADPNAIKLMFQAKNGEWVHGGYVPKAETQKVRDLGGSVIGARVAFWRNRGYWRAPYVQLLYRDRIKRVAVTNQTLLTPSIVTESYWVSIHSRRYKTYPRMTYGKWLLFVDKKQLDSVWHRVAYNVESGCFGRGCTTAKCSTARESQYCMDSSEGVICVYTTRSAVDHVGFKLSKMTRIPKIRYKTIAATLAKIYAGDPGCTTKTITYNNGTPRLSNTKTKLVVDGPIKKH